MLSRRDLASALVGAGAVGAFAVGQSVVDPFRGKSTVGTVPTDVKYFQGQISLTADVPIQAVLITPDTADVLLRNQLPNRLRESLPSVSVDRFLTAVVAALPRSYELSRSYELGSETIRYTVTYEPHDPGGDQQYHYLFDEWLCREWTDPPSEVTVANGGATTPRNDQ